jgi:hypothetical protein
MAKSRLALLKEIEWIVMRGLDGNYINMPGDALAGCKWLFSPSKTDRRFEPN